jgi:hypothetical protein
MSGPVPTDPASGMERPRVSLGRLFMRHFLWVPLIPLTVGLVLSLVAWSIIAADNRLARDGIETVATFTARDIRTERDRDGNGVTRHYLGYTFVTESGDRVSARALVARATYESATVGAQVPVRYLPDHPGTSRLASEGSDRTGGLIFGLMGLALLAGGAGIGWFLLDGKLSAIRAIRFGEMREAQVLDHVATNTSVNGRLQYRFRWIDARHEPGESTMMDPARLPAAGTVVRVFVDPRTGRGWSEHDI